MPLPLLPLAAAAALAAAAWLVRQALAPKERNHFGKAQVAGAWQRQGGECPCCKRSLSRVDWDVHHADGDRSNNNAGNCVLACVECHHNCYHRKAGRPSKPRTCQR